MLAGLWNEDNLYQGAPIEVDAWRKGVKKAGTFKEFDKSTWLTAGRSADIFNDTIVVGSDPSVIEDDVFGKVGYTREVTNIVDKIGDFYEMENHNAELELVKNLSEFYHSFTPESENQCLPEDEEDYIRIQTREELETNLAQNVGDKPYKLTETEEHELWATVVGYEEHKKDVYNRGIPEKFWPEGGYPEEGVNVTEKAKNSEYWTCRKDDD